MDDRLTLYQALHDLTAQMVVAAQASAWDQLLELEERLAPVRERLMRGSSLPTSAMPAEELAATTALIRAIQTHHETIRNCVQPHLEELRQLMNDTTSRRRLDAAYNPANLMGSGL
jgi:transcription termination factor NusB